MKTLVIFDSNYGNTQKVAEAIAKELSGKAVKFDSVSENDLKDVHMLVVGSPINGWRPTENIMEFLKNIDLKNINAAAFDTRMNVWYKGDAVKKMTRSLATAGAEVVGQEGFFVKDKEGPLAVGELDRAKKWAKSLI